MMDKKVVPISFHAKNSALVLYLYQLFPGKEIIMQKSDESIHTLTMEDVNMGCIDNPLTGNMEVTVRLTLKKPIDEEPET